MLSQSEIYYKNNPSVTTFNIKYGFTTMQKTFGQQLKEKMDEVPIKPAELSRLSGVTKQNIGRLLNETPHPITGAPPTTTAETVEKLAPYVNWDVNEALSAAGFAPQNIVIKSELPDFLYQFDYSIFSESDRAEIENFIKFKADSVKTKSFENVRVYPKLVSNNEPDAFGNSAMEDHTTHHPKDRKVVIATIIEQEDLDGLFGTGQDKAENAS